MATIYYGVHHFNKNLGYYGERTICPNCGRTYKKIYIKQSRWIHIDYIPLIPLTSVYAKVCPACAMGEKVKGKDAKREMAASGGNSSPELKFYVRHIKADKRYEFWYRDLSSGEEVCIDGELRKGELKLMLKERGMKLKKVEMTEV